MRRVRPFRVMWLLPLGVHTRHGMDRRNRAAASSSLAIVGVLGILAAVGLSSCGGGGEAIGTGGITGSLPAVTAPARSAPVAETLPAATETVVLTETTPGVIQTGPAATETVTLTETAPAVIETVTQTVPAATTSAVAPVTVTATLTTTVTTTEGVSPAAAAAAAAAASESEEGLTSTEWGWVAFGLLAAAVVIGGVVWWVRRRSAAKASARDTPPSPDVSA